MSQWSPCQWRAKTCIFPLKMSRLATKAIFAFDKLESVRQLWFCPWAIGHPFDAFQPTQLQNCSSRKVANASTIVSLWFPWLSFWFSCRRRRFPFCFWCIESGCEEVDKNLHQSVRRDVASPSLCIEETESASLCSSYLALFCHLASINCKDHDLPEKTMTITVSMQKVLLLDN